MSNVPAVYDGDYTEQAPTGPVLGIQIPGFAARPVEVGRIRAGKKGAKGNPTKLDRFRFTSSSRKAIDAIAAKYGGKVSAWNDPTANPPEQWEVVVEASEVEIVLPAGAQLSQTLERWNNGGADVRTDGVTDFLTGQPWRGPTDFAGLKAAGIKPTTRLSVMLPGIPGFGVWRLESHGWNAAAELAGALDVIRMAGLAGKFQVGYLTLQDRMSKSGGQTKRYKVPTLVLDATPEALVEAANAHMAALVSGAPQLALETPKPKMLHEPRSGTADFAFIDEEPVVPGVTDVMIPSVEAKQALIVACGGDKGLAAEMWGNRGRKAISVTELNALIDGIVLDAEIIDDKFDIEDGE